MWTCEHSVKIKNSFFVVSGYCDITDHQNRIIQFLCFPSTSRHIVIHCLHLLNEIMK